MAFESAWRRILSLRDPAGAPACGRATLRGYLLATSFAFSSFRAVVILLGTCRKSWGRERQQQVRRIKRDRTAAILITKTRKFEITKTDSDDSSGFTDPGEGSQLLAGG